MPVRYTSAELSCLLLLATAGLIGCRSIEAETSGCQGQLPLAPEWVRFGCDGGGGRVSGVSDAELAQVLLLISGFEGVDSELVLSEVVPTTWVLFFLETSPDPSWSRSWVDVWRKSEGYARRRDEQGGEAETNAIESDGHFPPKWTAGVATTSIVGCACGCHLSVGVVSAYQLKVYWLRRPINGPSSVNAAHSLADLRFIDLEWST